MSDLFAKQKTEYGNNYQEHLLEQYKLYIESVEKTSDRRQHANNYFITINTTLVSLVGFSSQIKIFENLVLLKLVLALVGTIICGIFWFLIRAYKQLNTGKFEVIHEIEQHLPLALYKYEWKVLGDGKDNKKYYPFSHIELIIPWVFGIIYAVLGLYFLGCTINSCCRM